MPDTPDNAAGNVGGEPTRKNFGPFEVLREVSAGTLGEVYLCRRTGGTARDAVPFIVKTFKPDLVERRQEIDVLERPLHRCLIQYRQVGYDAEAERYFTVMDRLEVKPHSHALLRTTRLNFKQKIKRFMDLGEALSKLHELPDRNNPPRPLFHGALKPSNILVRKPETDYHMLITDFGFLYRYSAEVWAESHSYFETWLFMPPEVILHAVPEFWPKHGPPPRPCPA
ncbi:MAG: protein kinase, partial [Planctomycetota bacterium]